MSEIKFGVKRDGKDVVITVCPFSNVNLHMPLRFTLRDEMDAEAYYRLIRDGMAERVLAIRRDAYERGYRDGRARRKYDEPIYDCINTEEEPRP